MRERRVRGFQGPSASLVGIRPYEQSADDWLGDVSDDDWSEDAAERAERRRATPAYQELPSPPPDRNRPDAVRFTPEDEEDAAEAHRAAIERRRLVAGLVLVVLLAIAVAIPALILRGGEPDSVTPAVEPTPTTTLPSESGSPPTSTGPTTTTTPTGPSTSGPTTTTPTTPTTPSTTNSTGFTLPEGTKLRRGEENDPAVVRALQQALAAAGYDPGPADGTFGEKTEAAVVAFQQDNDLSADGVVGAATAAALNGTESSPDGAESTPGGSGSTFSLPDGTKLRRGEETDPAVVRALQQALAAAGYDPGSADGTFGEKTEAAVVAFQQDNDLSADGVVGPETAAALSGVLSRG